MINITSSILKIILKKNDAHTISFKASLLIGLSDTTGIERSATEFAITTVL
jgi:hypothetical protein